MMQETEDLRLALSRSLIEAEAARALYTAGCRYTRVLMPHVVRQLTCLDPGECDPLRVVAIDEKGQLLNGPKGLMSADDIVRELRLDPEFRQAGGW
jgi:hypothetical protein